MTAPAGPAPDASPPSLTARVDGVCNQFEAAWKDGRRPRIEDFLGRWDGPERSALLRELLALDAYYRRAAGEACRPEDYQTRFPELDPKGLADAVAGLTFVLPAAAAPAAAQTVSGYELLEELGRGAMGVVYKARQRGLNRTVALKMVLAGAHAAAQQRARFLVEAEMIARLDHPHIVNVHEFGEQGGVPFLALEYVAGGTLADLLGGRPWPAQQAAALVEKLARAVEHAHRHGVLHRDLKPANILLQAPEGQATIRDLQSVVPKISDFGLAKPLTGTARLTASDAILGTPAYMAPEQAGGAAHAGAAADVYALGVILYEMLAGRVPFLGATPLETLRLAAEQEPPPLAHVRPPVPRDLARICHKCLEKAPARRYASAGELADDLRRYVDGEPVRVRPVGPAERAWKWARRRPALAGLLGVSAAALLALLIGGAVYNVRLEAALKETQAERSRAEENLQRARQAVDRYFTRVSESTLLNVQGLQPLRRELLEDALSYYRDFLRQRVDDPTLTRDVGIVQYRIAWMLREIGTDAEALAANQQARTTLEKLLAQDPGDREALDALAWTWRDLGELQARAASLNEALRSYERARQICADLAEQDPRDPRIQNSLGVMYHDVGNLQSRLGRPAEARQSYERAGAILEQLVQAEPNQTRFQEQLARLVHDRGSFHLKAHQPAPALQAYQRARDIFRKLLDQQPGNTNYLDRLAASIRETGLAHYAAGRKAEAMQAFQEALPLRQRLADANPDVPLYQENLANLYASLGHWYTDARQPAEALAYYQQERAVEEALVKRHPDRIRFQRELALTSTHVGNLQRRAGRPAEAIPLHQRAVALRRQIADKNPHDLGDRSALGVALNDLAVALSALDRHEEAAKVYQDAVANQRVALAGAPQVAQYRTFLGNHYTGLASEQRRLGRHADAAETMRRYQELWPRDPDKLCYAAGGWALCVAAVGQGKADLSAAEQAQRRQYGDAALAALRQAIALGYKDLDQLKKEENFDPVRDREDFRQLLRDLEEKQNRGPAGKPAADGTAG
jgi:serine/threonine-protein kinase